MVGALVDLGHQIIVHLEVPAGTDFSPFEVSTVKDIVHLLTETYSTKQTAHRTFFRDGRPEPG